MAAEPELEITLDPVPGAGQGQQVAGGKITGRVECRAGYHLYHAALVVFIGWRTEGSGTPDSCPVFQDTIHDGPIPAGYSSYPFTARLPPGPMSHDGPIVTIRWEIEVRLVDRAKGSTGHRRRFIVVPPVIADR